MLFNDMETLVGYLMPNFVFCMNNLIRINKLVKMIFIDSYVLINW